MLNGSNLRKCNSCGKEFEKSGKACPYCGKSPNSGLFLKLILGIGILAIISAYAIPLPRGPMNDLQKIVDAPIDQIDASELAWMLNNRGANTNNSIEYMENEIAGKIVQWELEVFVITRASDYFKIVTKPTFDSPGTLLTLYPQDNQQRIFLDNIHPGNTINIKGKITGTQQNRIKINPAVIL